VSITSKLIKSALAIAAMLTPVAAPSLASAASYVAPPVVPPAARSAADSPLCEFGSCYDYVFGRQIVATSNGATVSTLVADPQLNRNFNLEHSLQELSVQNTAGTNTVEVGWIVDHNLNGDYLPHLFTYYWVNDVGECYNERCSGFVQTSATLKPGDALAVGSTANIGLVQVNSNWQVQVNGTQIGFFPGSLWNGAFSQGQQITAFGEVAMDSTDIPSCTQMGNGQFGTSQSSSWMSNFQLRGASVASNLTVTSRDPAFYDQGSVTATGFHLGGPGSNTTCNP
jgi:hypothetical protein